MFKLLHNLYAPETITGAGGGNPAIEEKGLSKEGIVDFLNEPDEVQPEDILDLTDKGGKKTPVKAGEEKPEETPETEETSEETTEEVDELAELEKELEEPSEEQLELVTPVRRKEILTKYPQLFKDFPYLEKAYYREQQFTELFPTINDAKEAQEAVTTLNNFEAEVMAGKTDTILKSVKQTNPESFNRIVDNYLGALKEADEGAYFHVLSNISKNTVIAMVREARASKNDALESAAVILNQFLFGTSDFKAPTNLAKDENPQDKTRETEHQRKEQEFNRRQFETSRGELNERVNTTITTAIKSHIDPKNTMTEFVKNAAIREVTEGLQRLVSKDARFISLVDKMWEAHFKDGFSTSSKDRIRKAFLSKAQTVLPALIKQARMNALKGMGKRVSSDEVAEQPDRKGPIASGRPRSQQPSGKIKEAKDIPKGMRTIDFLSQD